jgi:two-component system, NtrC family, sensor kinase
LLKLVGRVELMTSEPPIHFELRPTATRLVGAILVSLVLLGAITYLDEERGAKASFADYAAEQARVAKTAASALGAGLESRGPVTRADVLLEASTRLHALEQPGEVLVFLRPPGAKLLLTLDGVETRSPSIEERLAAGAADGTWVRLAHPEAAALGLPARTAVAGIAEFEDGQRARWQLVLVATAHRERDREERGQWRVALGFALASAIVVTLGTLALRMQRTELELGRRLAVAEAVRARDDRLVRADKLATLGALATGIAHQVSTPLGVIVGRAGGLLPRVTGDPKATRAVAMISEQARRINAIVRGFLRLARGGAPTFERVEPGVIARDAVELVEHRFEEAGVTIGAEIADRLPEIDCDPRLFEQVIVNLLLNGCDACNRGGSVALRVRSLGEGVAFIVEDDGPGITEEAARRATEPFFTTKSPEEGTGLGLAIASEIVNHHRGKLTLEPLPLRGTRATVAMPAPNAERIS